MKGGWDVDQRRRAPCSRRRHSTGYSRGAPAQSGACLRLDTLCAVLYRRLRPASGQCAWAVLGQPRWPGAWTLIQLRVRSPSTVAGVQHLCTAHCGGRPGRWPCPHQHRERWRGLGSLQDSGRAARPSRGTPRGAAGGICPRTWCAVSTEKQDCPVADRSHILTGGGRSRKDTLWSWRQKTWRSLSPVQAGVILGLFLTCPTSCLGCFDPALPWVLLPLLHLSSCFLLTADPPAQQRSCPRIWGVDVGAERHFLQNCPEQPSSPPPCRAWAAYHLSFLLSAGAWILGSRSEGILHVLPWRGESGGSQVEFCKEGG